MSRPARSCGLPDDVDDTAGAMVEPGGNALRAVQAAAVAPGERLLVVGTGTIGLLAAQFARADGVEVHLAGVAGPGAGVRARAAASVTPRTLDDLPDVPFDAVIDASNAMTVPARVVHLVEPGRRVVFIGLSAEPSLVDTREIALKDVTAVGILGASAGLAGHHLGVRLRRGRPASAGRRRRTAWTRRTTRWPDGDPTTRPPPPRSTSTHDSRR